MNEKRPLPAEVQAKVDELHEEILARSGFGEITIRIANVNAYTVSLSGLDFRITLPVARRW